MERLLSDNSIYRRYRPEIDGLRAVAIIAVVLFHCEAPWFRGGFIGVDIFFVISGYLITTIVADEMQRGKFSWITFYERRARRILPALFVMLAVVSLVLLIRYPIALYRSASTMASAVAFASNIQLTRASIDYLNQPTSNPFLHTWTLGVEEQFYIIYPALLFGLISFVKRGKAILLFAAIMALLCLSIVATKYYPVAAFYSTPIRFWEFLIGGIIVFLPAPQAQPVMMQLISVLSAFLMGIPIVLFSTETPFPGFAALMPALGAALLIYSTAKESTWVSWALSTNALTGIGRISYSLYLWHWPMLTIAAYLAMPLHLTFAQRLSVAAIAVVVSIASYRFVEQPFRPPRKILGRRQLFAFGLISAAMILAFGVAAKLTGGLSQLQSASTAATLKDIQSTRDQFTRCLAASPQAVTLKSLCRFGSAKARPTFVIWGDSHVLSLAPAIGRAASQYGYAGYFIGGRNCAPLVGFSPDGVCNSINSEALKLISRLKPNIVFIGGAWVGSADGSAVKRAEAMTIAGSERLFAASLDRSLEAVRAQAPLVVLVKDVPQYDWDVPIAAMNGKNWGKPLAAHLALQARSDDIIGHARKQFPFTIVDPSDVLCSKGFCETMQHDRPLYIDQGHISIFGAQRLSPLFQEVFLRKATPEQ